METGNPVRPEPVEGLSFTVLEIVKKGVGFDKLSPNGSSPSKAHR
jgi:hypothetical protein